MGLKPAFLLLALHKLAALEKFYANGLLKALQSGICGPVTREDIQIIPTISIVLQRVWKSTVTSTLCIFLGMNGLLGEIKNSHQLMTSF